MAYDTFTGSMSATFSWNAGKNGPSSSLNFPATTNGSTTIMKIAYVIGGNIANGVNENMVLIEAITASSSVTLSLQALTDVLNTASVVLVRLKGYFFDLLSVAQDATNGTAASAVVIQGGASNPNTLNLGGTTPTLTLNNGEFVAWATGQAGGITVSASVLNLKLANSDGSNAANILMALYGATT